MSSGKQIWDLKAVACNLEDVATMHQIGLFYRKRHKFILLWSASFTFNIPQIIRNGFVFVLIAQLLVFITQSVESFNLEPRLPIIKRGESLTFFGYSVAQHKNEQSRLLLVGAPLADSNIPGAQQSGAIFQCPFTVNETDCRILPINTDNKVASDGFVSNSSRSWLGISLSSQGAGKSVLACAHLYRKSKVLKDNSTVILIPGVCHSFTNTLAYHKMWDGCQGMKWEDTEKSPHELFGQCLQGVGSYVDPESNQMLIGAPAALNYKGVVVQNWIERTFGQVTKWRLNDVNIASSRGAPRRPVFYSDTTSPSPNGAPGNGSILGLDTYLGMAVVIGHFVNNRNETVYVAGAPRSQLTGEVLAFTGGPSHASELVYHGRLRQGSVGSQFGYTLAKADVNGDGLDDLFVGAPNFFTNRAQQSRDLRYYGAFYAYYNVLGEGLPFDRRSTANHRHAGEPSTASPAVFYGKSFEGRFGLALAAAGDLNNDGYGDLAVGAPYQDDNHGAVYIFQGSEKGLAREPSQIIKSGMLPFKPALMSFGSSLSGGMDLDGNGYPDLLVGAYASDAVVALLARPVVKIFTEVRGLPQRGINASGEPCRGFNRVCFSFKVCHDLQAVGEFSAAQVRARYRIEGDVVKTLPSTKRITFGENPDALQLPRYIIERTILLNTRRLSPSTAPISAGTLDPFTCADETVFLDDAAAEDTLNPLLFRLTSELVEKQKPEYPLRTLPRMDEFPIFDRLSASKSFQVNFTNDCGDDSVCESDLRIDRVALDLPHDDGENNSNNSSRRYSLVGGASDKLNLTLHIENRGELAYQAKLFIKHPAMLPLVRFYAPPAVTCAVVDRRTTTSTVDDGASNTELNGGADEQYDQNDIRSSADWQQSSVVNGAIQPPSSDVASAGDDAVREIQCDLGNPLAAHKPLHIVIEFETRNIQPLDNEFGINLRTDTISQKLEPRQSPLDVIVRVVVRADAILLGSDPQGQVIYDGIARGASELRILSDVGSPVVHEYELYNDGPGTLPTSRLTILWPIEIAPNKKPYFYDSSASSSSASIVDQTSSTSNYDVYYKHNKWLLYLSAPPVFDRDAGVVCSYPESWINPLHLGGVEKLKQSMPTTVSRRISTAAAVTSPAVAASAGTIDGATGKRIKRSTILSRPAADETDDHNNGDYNDADAAAWRARSASKDYEDVTNKKVVTFSCADRERSARCITIECTIPSMERGATTVIRIISRLWKHTFLQNYRNVDYVRIASVGKLSIDPVYRIQQVNTDNDEAHAITRAIPSATITADEVQKIAPWVIPLAVAVGLLLLVCIILALWKCGFFSRRRYTLNNNNNNNHNHHNRSGSENDDAGPPFPTDSYKRTVNAAAAAETADFNDNNNRKKKHHNLNDTFVSAPHHTTDIMLPVLPSTTTTRDVGGEAVEEFDTRRYLAGPPQIHQPKPIASPRHRQAVVDADDDDADLDNNDNVNDAFLQHHQQQQQRPLPPPKPATVRLLPSGAGDAAVRYNRNGGSSSNNGSNQQPEVVIDPSRRRLAGASPGVYSSARGRSGGVRPPPAMGS